MCVCVSIYVKRSLKKGRGERREIKGDQYLCYGRGILIRERREEWMRNRADVDDYGGDTSVDNI